MKKKYRMKKISKPAKDKIIALIALVILIACFFSVYSMFNVYDGPGVAKETEANTFSSDGYFWSEGRLCYEDETRNSVPFVDVSEYQGEIDWDRVKKDGISHAMIRIGFRSAGGGEIIKDSCYSENVKRTKKAGIERGVYFFSQAVNTEESVEEARYVLRHIRGKGIELPVVFDMEHITGGDRISKLSIKEKTEITDAFCETIEKHGHEAVVYGNPTWLNRNLQLEYLTDYKIWLAHYTDITDFDKAFSMMQYTDCGNVSGIKGYVDLNFMVKDKENED